VEECLSHLLRRTYIIADDEAVKVLLDKLLSGGSHQQRPEKLLKAIDEASQRYSKHSHGLVGRRVAGWERF
jgi:hypothetical protein